MNSDVGRALSGIIYPKSTGELKGIFTVVRSEHALLASVDKDLQDVHGMTGMTALIFQFSTATRGLCG